MLKTSLDWAEISLQAEYLLSAAASADSSQLALYSVQPSPVCGNGLCEIGERPGGNSTSSLSQGQPVSAVKSSKTCSAMPARIVLVPSANYMASQEFQSWAWGQGTPSVRPPP